MARYTFMTCFDAFPIFQISSLAGYGSPVPVLAIPGLMTVLALHALHAADTVIYDALVSEEILALANENAELIYAGKRGGKPSPKQHDISHKLIGLAREGRRVLRLKGGDPFIFGRGGEEALSLVAAGVDFRVIPGVSAGIGGLAYAGIPLPIETQLGRHLRDWPQCIRYHPGQCRLAIRGQRVGCPGRLHAAQAYHANQQDADRCRPQRRRARRRRLESHHGRTANGGFDARQHRDRCCKRSFVPAGDAHRRRRGPPSGRTRLAVRSRRLKIESRSARQSAA